MDKKKLDKWAELLLDTGKRNSLINFKDHKTSTVEILHPSFEDLFNKIEDSVSFEVYTPSSIEDEDASEDSFDADSPENKTKQDLNKKESYYNKHINKINSKKKNVLLPYNKSLGDNSAISVKSIDKKYREIIEETGVNVAFMVFGFISWKEDENSKEIYRAPILLVQIQLEKASAIEPYVIKPAEDDVIVNPTFSYKMEADHGVKLPEYKDEGLLEYLKNVETIVKKLKWEVTHECKIGLFSFLKINMYNDLKANSEAILANNNVRLLLGEPLDNEGDDFNNEGKNVSVKDPLIELHNVVDADSSQIEAIIKVKSGKSFVLQGPPGTGKSQTITNIIAECLYEGKKVLFVSEKQTALNVVYDKLKQADLTEYCLQLHNHKANKKNVISEIYNTLRNNKSITPPKDENDIYIKQEAKKKLDQYASELHKQRPVIEQSLYQLYQSYTHLNSNPEVEYIIPNVVSKNNQYLREAVDLLKEYVAYIPTIGYDYKKNAWYGYINQDSSYQTKKELKDNLTSIVKLLQVLNPLQKEISERYQIECSNIKNTRTWNNFFGFISTSKIITVALLDRACFKEAKSSLNALKALSLNIISLRDELKDVFNDAFNKLNGEAYHSKLTKKFSGSIFRWYDILFGTEYKKIIADLYACKKEGKKPTYEEAVKYTAVLCEYQKKKSEYADKEGSIKSLLGVAYRGIETDWSYVTEQMYELERILDENLSFGSLASFTNFNTELEAFADYAKRINNSFENCNEEIFKEISGYFGNSFNLLEDPSSQLLDRFELCLKEFDNLDQWCSFRNLLSKLKDKQVMPYIDTVIQQNIEPSYIEGAFEKKFYWQWIDLIWCQNPVFKNFNRIAQDKAICTFSEKDIKQFDTNKAKIRSVISSKIPPIDVIAPKSPLSIIMREGEKKRKLRSIRTLFSEAGAVIQSIKPCFLMSPLSVSTFIDKDSIHFDVVIFDEASQIFPQDAIGAIYRTNQVIVVGDSKQMPPGNFFQSSIESDSNDSEIDDVTDFESILDLCSTCMQQLSLSWHYRSRYEQLIAFSNKNYYSSKLLTFPSAKTDAEGIGVDYYHVDGIFDRKAHCNLKEAEFVVDLIYKNIEKYPNRSLGVLAFSVAQQDLIDRQLSRRRQNTPDKEYFFNSDKNEPFFIKNLETVQGDERDTIIFSVAYGYDGDGRLLQNFGPLNKAGGERRLNVAVTRAKYNVQVVSSMHYTDIDLKRTQSEGCRLLREYLDYAENGEDALKRSLNVKEKDQFDSPFEVEVCEFLRSRGFSVDPQVGCSSFKIDLGLKLPDSSNYVLAIECDGASYHSSKNARDRDRLRQQILENMGWKFYRIWSTDWFKNKENEKRLLEEVARKAVCNPINKNDVEQPKPEEKKPEVEKTQERLLYS